MNKTSEPFDFSETAFLRVLLWIRFPHLGKNPFPWIEYATMEERLNAVILLLLENPSHPSQGVFL